MKKIFIDAGHNNNGWNTGVIWNGLKEQDITFYVAKKLSERLKDLGLETKLSRPKKEINLGTDNSSSIYQRYKMSNDWEADFFISIHCNAGGGTGAETLYYKEDSLEFAKIVQNIYVEEMDMRNRGVKFRNDIGVIKNANAKAILVELGFLDTDEDFKILQNDHHKIVNALTKGFAKILNIEYIESIEEQEEMRYNKIIDLPTWGKDTVEKLIEKGFLYTDNDNLNLSYDMLRIFVINDRAGLYGN